MSSDGSSSGSAGASSSSGPASAETRVIPAWDPAALLQAGKFPAALFVAARGEGKSVLLRYLYQRVIARAKAEAGFKYTFVYSNSPATLASYAEFVEGFVPADADGDAAPVNFIDFARDGESHIARLLEAQARRGPRAPRVLIILDDVLTADLRNNDTVTQLFTQGRHSRVAVFLVSQAWSGALSPAVRKNTDILFFLRGRSGIENKMIRDETIKGCIAPDDVGRVRLPSGVVPASEERLARGILQECTGNYRCLVVDQRVRETRADRMLAWFRVPEKYAR